EVLFITNVQHDCREGKCGPTGKKMQLQERQESGVEIQVIEHTELDRFIINTHALHNSHLLRKTLPRGLIQPIPYSTNRREMHDKLAASLRETQSAK
ncbi:uncharacterized protein LACBIDRAFT_148809, partial [Laccaria bicolor S238N-H82]